MSISQIQETRLGAGYSHNLNIFSDITLHHSDIFFGEINKIIGISYILLYYHILHPIPVSPELIIKNKTL